MEEIKKEKREEFAFTNLKIRTMHDDLRKHTGQADLSDIPVLPPEKPATPTITSPPPEESKQPSTKRAIPEPPPYLPTKPAPPQPESIEPQPEPIAPAQEPEPSESSASSPSVLKLQSNLIYKETPRSEPEISLSRRLKFALMFGAPAAIIISVIFGFIYFYFSTAPPPLCPQGQITEECRCSEQSEETKTTGFCCDNLWVDFDCTLTKLPEPLIPSIDQILTIDAQGDTLTNLVYEIEKSDNNISDEGARIIALKLANYPSRYATLDELINIFGIVLPEDIKENNQAFNLLLYVNLSPNYLTSSAPEYRLALVLRQKNKSALEQIMQEWEETLLEDMKPMVLGQPEEPATAEFVSTVYRNGFFRYKNLPIKTTTINYTIYQDLIILGTSKNSIFYVYDAFGLNNSDAGNY
ncbi:MAG: hypothetical protein A2Y98_00300 [Candidatus Portnoybacteria bacterium RBG_19FT_COMBO_36_7]|uniref:Uncharacterized protein n=1 Tax=Candidatus Portnoybacteria bacterium RBG_19FT_COMBO_36_7 TaxID=1801992 RepID=A0A1G2F8K9_9BACT|nr:MAG: hypothetical protein A2Y98_00300 [Candidatus Portnoybacteria bacterium RBG_19FT_COMBO_36_7]